MRKYACLALAAAALMLAPAGEGAGGARAQERDAPKIEVGVQFSSLSVTPPGEFTGTTNVAGLGGRVTYNLTDHFALEAEMNFHPDQSFSQTVSAGGSALQGQFGVKAGRRFERFGVFARARPGFVSFGNTVRLRETTVTFGGQTFPSVDFSDERKTHLSLDVGGVLEFYPSRRLLVRFDAGDTIIRYGERADFAPAVVTGPGGRQRLLATLPAATKHNFQFTAGVGFRFRGPDAAEPEAAEPLAGKPRFEVGLQFSALVINQPVTFFPFPLTPEPVFGAETESGFGGRFTFNLTDHVALEAEGNFYPRKNFPDSTFGGYPSQAQFGVKAGRRFRRFGVFAKARPGFVSFGEVRQLTGTQISTFTAPGGVTQQFTLGIFEDRRKTYFSTDVGGVLELYPARRVVARFDAGDTVIRYGLRHQQGFFLSRAILEIPAETRHNFQFSAGIGLRF